jgi:predicted transcriptional regulator
MDGAMSKKTLTITLQPDWKAALRQAGRRASSRSYQGEVLNFESPGVFFGRMTERRWAIVRALRGQGEIALLELARRVERDVKRVHDDVQELLDFGLVERGEGRGVMCPFATVHIGMELRAAA